MGLRMENCVTGVLLGSLWRFLDADFAGASVSTADPGASGNSSRSVAILVLMLNVLEKKMYKESEVR